jgi:hypothetical protein
LARRQALAHSLVSRVCQPGSNNMHRIRRCNALLEPIDVLDLYGGSFRGYDESKHVGAKPACACSQCRNALPKKNERCSSVVVRWIFDRRLQPLIKTSPIGTISTPPNSRITSIRNANTALLKYTKKIYTHITHPPSFLLSPTLPLLINPSDHPSYHPSNPPPTPSQSDTQS